MTVNGGPVTVSSYGRNCKFLEYGLQPYSRVWDEDGLGAAFVVLLLIALALPYFLDVDRYRRHDHADTTDQADWPHKVHNRENSRAIFAGGVGLTVAGLHIGNPRGFPEGDVLSADEIRVNVALGPLLHRTIHVNSGRDLVPPETFPGDR